MSTRRLLCTLLLLAAVAAGPATAQTLTGSIAGVVKDSQGGLIPGVTVTLTGPRGSQEQVSDAEGRYRFLALEPGTYALVAALTGFQDQKQASIVITAGRSLDIELSMKVAGQSETVTVVGGTPVVDVKSSATETTISQDLLFSAPITRTAVNVLNYAPGINSSSAYGGESGSGNALLIDGVDTRDPSGGTAWTFYNYNMVEEIQFQGLGAQAEYGGFTGAVVNTITKSGGNRFSGLFDLFGTNSSLSSSNISAENARLNPNLADPARVRKYIDLTTQVGGPIVPSRLFFFGSAQRFLLETDPSGPVTRRHEVSPRLNGKVTWQPTSSDNITGHVQYDSYNIIGRVPGAYSLVATDSTTNREDAPEYVWLAQWRHIFGSSTFSEVKYTGWSGFYDLNPEVTLSGHYDENGLHTVSQGWFYYGDRQRSQVNASVSHYASKFGHHELKFGAEFERSKTRDRYGYNNGILFYDYGGAPYLAYSYGYDITATNTRQSVFAQDSWKIGDRFTANLGVRGDYLQGGNPDVGKVYDSANWAPRLGFAWDLAGDSRSVVKASYGWYYEGAQTQLFTRAVPGLGDYITYNVNPDYSLGSLSDLTPAVLYRVADGIKHPRVDETTLGFERALSNSMRFSATGVWRDNRNFVNSVAPLARWQPVTTTTGLGTDLTVYRWANRTTSNQDFEIRNVKGFQYLDPSGNVIGTADPFRRYRALMLVLSRRYVNRWQAQASYVLSKSTGNVDNTSGAQVSTRQFETPNLALVNAEGNLTNDRRHEFKLLGSYQIPIIETSINAYFAGLSGRNYTPFQQLSNTILNATGASTQYRRPLLESRGSRRYPRELQLDLRIEKNVTVAGNRFGIYADIQNAFNRGGVTAALLRVPGTSVVTPAGLITLPFETPGTIQDPRQLRIGGRWSF